MSLHMRSVRSQYPQWLSEHKDTTERGEYDNYVKQHKIIEAICVEFEAETDPETEEVKRLRFEKLMDLMQQVRELFRVPASAPRLV